MEETDKIKERKEKVSKWLSDSDNLILVGVIVFAFAIRFFYFLATKYQPLWWDEAVYGTLAKNILFNGKWDGTFLINYESIIRPPLFWMVWGILLKFGFGEASVRFLLELVPSTLSVYFVYLLGKEGYNKKIGLISAFAFATMWIHLFYTSRLLTNVFGMAFLFPSFYYFLKSQKGKFNPKYFGAAIFLLSLSTLSRYPNGIFFLAYLVFLGITVRTDLLKNKKFWIAGIIGMLPLLLFFGVNQVTHGNIFPAFLGSEYISDNAGTTDQPFAFHLLNFIPLYLKTAFLLLFFIGLAVTALEVFLGHDMIKKKDGLKAHLLMLLILVSFYAFFIFYMKAAEDRWLFPSALPLVILVGIGSVKLYEFIKPYNKNLALGAILVILLFGAYQNVTTANTLIESRKSSFIQMRQGFEWLKTVSPEDAVVSGNAVAPYVTYYAERHYSEPITLEEYYEVEGDLDYFVLQGLTPPADYVQQYFQETQNQWTPINVLFVDAQQQQPIFIIYEKNANQTA